MLLILPAFLLAQSTMPVTENLTAQKDWVEISSQKPVEAQVNLLYSDVESSGLEIIMMGYWEETIRTVDGNAEIKVTSGNSTPMLIKGAPDLEKLTASLAIPDRASMGINVIEEEYVDFEDVNIIPSKGNLTRDIDPDEVPYTYGREYETDAFWPGVAATFRSPHIIRDVRGQVVVIHPFRYNAVKKVLRVYKRLVLEVAAVDNNGENQLTGRRGDGKTDRNFQGIYSRNFLNYQQYEGTSRYTPVEEDGNMLIISHGPFMADMQEFVDWKNMSGIPTEMVDVSAVGTTSADIKTYVANYYSTNGLTFLLLVGDAAQVPTSYSSGDSDNDYGYIVGGDHYPDIFVGRFSAESNADVQTQVQRTIDYEKNPGTSLGSFERAMCIASDQGPGDDGEYDWEHQRNIRSDYMGFTYTYGAELYDGSQEGEDATGNPTSAMVGSEVDAGTGIITYTGHGSTYSWSTSGFGTAGVNALANNDMLPFIISVACVNGNFVGNTCFGEAWLRATHNGEPSGAIATIMSTINQSWSPPMRGQDEMVDILVETYSSNIKRTFGGICMNGCMNMNDVYGSQGDEMTDTWTIFGDPSLMVRTAQPAAMTVSHPADLPVGSAQIAVTCDQEGARVAVSDDYQLLGTGIVSGGGVDVTFDPINSEDTIKVTVTAFNCLPHIDSVIVTDADMAYVSSTALHDNLDGIAPGDTNAEILGVKVVMSGSMNAFDLQSLTFNLNGTTDLSDLTSLRVYYTGNSNTFGTSTLFGSASPATGDITVTGLQTLTGGNNYFWLAGDISPMAPTGDYIDAGCTGLILTDSSSVTRVPDITDPAGYRMVELDYCIPAYTYGTGYGDYISLVEVASLNNPTGASSSPYYTFYQDVTTHLVIDSSYQLIVCPGNYGSVNNIAAWIDFNRNGTFESHEKLGELISIPAETNDTIYFNVPDSAFLGTVRLRVREVYYTTSIDPCSSYNYGETEDYEVHIMPPGCWLGYTSEWNNPSNWSDGVVPGPGCTVTIPEILMGDYYPADFAGANPAVDQLKVEDGATMSIPVGTTFTVGSGN